jgi:hypothetical protein
MANLAVQSQTNGLANLGEALKVVSTGEPTPPLMEDPPKKKSQKKGSVSRCNKALKVLYGPTAGELSDSSAKFQLWRLIELVREGKLPPELEAKIEQAFRDAREYGDLCVDLKAAYLDALFDHRQFAFG